MAWAEKFQVHERAVPFLLNITIPWSPCQKWGIGLGCLLQESVYQTGVTNSGLFWFYWVAEIGPAAQPGSLRTAGTWLVFCLWFKVWPLVTFLFNYLAAQQSQKSCCVQASTDLIWISKLSSFFQGSTTLEPNERRQKGKVYFVCVATLSSKVEGFWKCFPYISDLTWSAKWHKVVQEKKKKRKTYLKKSWMWGSLRVRSKTRIKSQFFLYNLLHFLFSFFKESELYKCFICKNI